jgi:hypothetical protein
MVVQQQNPGWSSTPMAGGASNVDTFSRIMAMRYGGRTDDIWSYLDQPGYRRTLGGGSGSPSFGGNWTSAGSGSVAITRMGGNTPSNPGGYNWGTFGNVVKGFKENVANPILDKVMPTTGKSGQPAFRTGGIYGTYRGKQQQVQKAQTYQAAQQARQQQTQQAQATASMNQTMNAYRNAWNPSMNYGAAYQAGATAAQPPVQGPALPPPPTAGATRPSSNRPTFPKITIKGGQRQTRGGIIIPPGTRSI